MHIKLNRCLLTISWLKALGLRSMFLGRDEVARTTSLIEMGKEETHSFRVYYVGLGRLSVAFAVFNPAYKPHWWRVTGGKPTKEDLAKAGNSAGSTKLENILQFRRKDERL